MRLMEFDAAIFDLDGTLVDTLEDLGDSLNRVLGAHRYPVHDYEAYRLLIGHGIRRLVRDALPPQARDDATIDSCYEEMLSDYGENSLVKTHLYPGVEELLRGLRAAGVKLGVLSNKADDLSRRIVDALVAPGTFAVVLGARPGVPLKPDPEGALRVSRELGVAPVRTVYLGDSDVDMRTATRAGMLAVGVSWGFRSREELVQSGARAVLDSPLELLDLSL